MVIGLIIFMPKVTFANNNRLFFQSVKSSVDEYFTSNNIKKTGNWKLYLKTAILIPLAMVLYAVMLWLKLPAAVAVITCVVFSLTLVTIAFNVMHDACHSSYSSKKWVNELLGLTMNALGSNAFLWKIKHNVIHHTYTNIDGVDDDMSKSPVLRMCPQQKWFPAHRYQFLYMFLLYSLTTVFWLLIFDYQRYFQRKLYTTPINKIDTKEHILFWFSKIAYIVFYVAIPIAVLGFTPWIIGFLILHATMGMTLTIVFQLAHVVEKTAFEQAGEEPKFIDNDWAIHQVLTTADFAPKSKLVSWLVGGLNFQIEHHLFPRISHVHYPALSNIVRQECEKFNLPYHSYETMGEAVVSHFRVMKQLGKKELAIAV